jgi:hypothetical protein
MVPSARHNSQQLQLINSQSSSGKIFCCFEDKTRRKDYRDTSDGGSPEGIHIITMVTNESQGKLVEKQELNTKRVYS